MRSITAITILGEVLFTLLPETGGAASEADYRQAEPAATGVKRPEDLCACRHPHGWSRARCAGRTQRRDVFMPVAPRSSQPVVLYPSPSSGSEPDRQRFRDCPGPPDELGFSPHGLNAVRVKDGGTELYVVNHGGRESIEFFRVALAGAAPRVWIGCVPLPEHAFGNGVATLPGGGIVVTNMYNPSDPQFMRKFVSGALTGGVLAWTPGRGWSEAVRRQLSGATVSRRRRTEAGFMSVNGPPGDSGCFRRTEPPPKASPSISCRIISAGQTGEPCC